MNVQRAKSAIISHRGLFCLLCGGAFYLLCAVRCGASLPRLLIVPVVIGLCVYLPGYVLAKRFPLPNGAQQAGSMVLGLGAFLLCALLTSFLLGAMPGFPRWLLYALMAASCTFLSWRHSQTEKSFLRWIQDSVCSLPSRMAANSQGEFLLAAFGAVLLVLGLACARFAHPAAVGVLAPQQDFYWNVGNAESFLLGFPPVDLRYHGYLLTYHWLTELLAAGLNMAGGLSCFDAEAFVLPPLVLGGAWAVWAELGRRLWPSHPRRALALPLSFLLLGDASGFALLHGTSLFSNLLVLHLLTNINAMGTTLLLLGCFFSLLNALFGTMAPRPALAAPAVLCFFLLCVAKGPAAGLVALAVVCGVVLTRLGRHSARGQRKQLFFLVLAAMLLLVFFLCYRVLFSAGAGSSISFSSHATLEKGAFAPLLAHLQARSGVMYTLALPLCMVLQCFCMAPLAFALFCFGAVHTLCNWRNQPPSPLMLCSYALGFGGLLAFFLFDHPSMSQSYFAYTALVAVNLAALDALSPWQTFVAGCRRSVGVGLRAAAGALAALSVFSALCGAGYLVRCGADVLLFPAKTAEAHSAQYTPLTAPEEDALHWLNGHMPADALFATNRMHTGPAEEGLSNVYSALCGRMAYMESFKYAMSNLGAPSDEVAARYQLMSDLFGFDGMSDTARAQAVCAETGVRWLVFNKTLRGTQSAFEAVPFEKVFENDVVVIYFLP